MPRAGAGAAASFVLLTRKETGGPFVQLDRKRPPPGAAEKPERDDSASLLSLYECVEALRRMTREGLTVRFRYDISRKNPGARCGGPRKNPHDAHAFGNAGVDDAEESRTADSLGRGL